MKGCRRCLIKPRSGAMRCPYIKLGVRQQPIGCLLGKWPVRPHWNVQAPKGAIFLEVKT